MSYQEQQEAIIKAYDRIRDAKVHHLDEAGVYEVRAALLLATHFMEDIAEKAASTLRSEETMRIINKLIYSNYKDYGLHKVLQDLIDLNVLEIGTQHAQQFLDDMSDPGMRARPIANIDPEKHVATVAGIALKQMEPQPQGWRR